MSGFSISGLGSGIDWSNYIDSIKKAETQALSRTVGARQTKIAAVHTSLSNIKGLADSVKSAAQSFQFAKDFKTKTVSSSDSTVVSGTASLNAINQTNTVRVEQLATNEVWHATTANVNSIVTTSAQTLTITVRGVSNVLNVAAGTTLTQLAAQINSAGIGVTATTFDTGAGTGNTGRLAITDDNSGKFNPDQTAGINFNLGFSSTLTGLATGDFGATPIVEGVDSQVKINGSSTMYRDTNVVTDLIPGVTLNLLSADPGVDKTLTIGESSSNAGTKIADFLNKYNTLLLEIKKAIKIDPSLTAQTNPTAGNSTLRSVMDQLTSVVMSSVDSLPGSRSIRALVDIGVTSTYDQGNGLKNGQLSLDNSKLEAAISSNFGEVVEFFEGVTQGSIKYAGFGEKVSDVLDTILNFSTGTLPSAISASDAEITRLQDDIDKKLAKIDAKEQMLKAKFARLETVLAQLSSQQKSLSSALGSLPSAKKNE